MSVKGRENERGVSLRRGGAFYFRFSRNEEPAAPVAMEREGGRCFTACCAIRGPGARGRRRVGRHRHQSAGNPNRHGHAHADADKVEHRYPHQYIDRHLDEDGHGHQLRHLAHEARGESQEQRPRGARGGRQGGVHVRPRQNARFQERARYLGRLLGAGVDAEGGGAAAAGARAGESGRARSGERAVIRDRGSPRRAGICRFLGRALPALCS